MDRFVDDRKGILFVVSAPSGAGKTSLCRTMARNLADLNYSVSYTTRPPRPGEVSGRDYVFISRDEFGKLADRNEFAEWAEVHGNLYGTHAETIRRMLDEGLDIILDVDAQGAAQLKKRFPEGVFIYILPPSLEVLRERLYDRKSDSAEEIERRLKEARREVQTLDHYMYLIINDDFDRASRALESVIVSERVRIDRQRSDRIKKRFLEDKPLTGKER
jgi:guanylate kinase